MVYTQELISKTLELELKLKGATCNTFTVFDHTMCHQILRKHAELKMFSNNNAKCSISLKFPFRDRMSVCVLACVLISTAYFDSWAGLPDIPVKRKPSTLQIHSTCTKNKKIKTCNLSMAA